MGGQSIEPPTTPGQVIISSEGKSPLPTKGGDRSVNDRRAKAAGLESEHGRPSFEARSLDAMGVLVGQSSGIIHPKSLNSVAGERPPKLGTARNEVSGKRRRPSITRAHQNLLGGHNLASVYDPAERVTREGGRSVVFHRPS
jgi:hypothetical protein